MANKPVIFRNRVLGLVNYDGEKVTTERFPEVAALLTKAIGPDMIDYLPGIGGTYTGLPAAKFEKVLEIFGFPSEYISGAEAGTSVPSGTIA
jgi:hypothetical protein